MTRRAALPRTALTRASWLVAVLCVVSLGQAASARAQGELYRWGSADTAAAFRFAAANERWIVLEHDRDVVHQELVVLRAQDGVEVLRTEGMSLPPGSQRSVSESWDLMMRPFLSADRLLTFRTGEVLVALEIPSGRELWRISLPSRYMTEDALTVTDTHVAWADPDGGLRVFDAETGRRVWSAPMSPHTSGGCVALGPDGSASALTWEMELVSWNASGVELSRTPLDPDWGVYSLLRHGDLAVVLGSRIHVVDIGARTRVAQSTSYEWTSGAFVGDELVIGSNRGVEALDPRSLQARWRSPLVGDVTAVTPTGLGVLRENGVLTWLDPQTGAELGSMGIGQPHHIRLYLPRASWGVAAGIVRRPGITGLVQHLALVRDSRAAFVAFATPAAAPARPTRISGVVRINGRGRSGVLVQVGDQRVRSGPGGRFTARTALPGVIRVSVSNEELQRRAGLPCAVETHTLVDPSAPLRVSIDAGAHDYECDNACRCD